MAYFSFDIMRVCHGNLTSNKACRSFKYYQFDELYYDNCMQKYKTTEGSLCDLDRGVDIIFQ